MTKNKKNKKKPKAIRFLFAFDHRRRAHLVITSSLLLPRMILLFGAEAAAAVSARSSRPPTHPSQKEITDDSVTNTPPHAVAPFSALKGRDNLFHYLHIYPTLIYLTLIHSKYIKLFFFLNFQIISKFKFLKIFN